MKKNLIAILLFIFILFPITAKAGDINFATVIPNDAIGYFSIDLDRDTLTDPQILMSLRGSFVVDNLLKSVSFMTELNQILTLEPHNKVAVALLQNKNKAINVAFYIQMNDSIKAVVKELSNIKEVKYQDCSFFKQCDSDSLQLVFNDNFLLFTTSEDSANQIMYLAKHPEGSIDSKIEHVAANKNIELFLSSSEFIDDIVKNRTAMSYNDLVKSFYVYGVKDGDEQELHTTINLNSDITPENYKPQLDKYLDMLLPITTDFELEDLSVCSGNEFNSISYKNLQDIFGLNFEELEPSIGSHIAIYTESNETFLDTIGNIASKAVSKQVKSKEDPKVEFSKWNNAPGLFVFKMEGDADKFIKNLPAAYSSEGLDSGMYYNSERRTSITLFKNYILFEHSTVPFHKSKKFMDACGKLTLDQKIISKILKPNCCKIQRNSLVQVGSSLKGVLAGSSDLEKIANRVGNLNEDWLGVYIENGKITILSKIVTNKK